LQAFVQGEPTLALAVRFAFGQQMASGLVRVALRELRKQTILAYVRDGCGVGVISDGALAEPAGLVVRGLDPAVFLPIEAKLVCRRRAGSGEELDLTEGAEAWWRVLQRVGK